MGFCHVLLWTAENRQINKTAVDLFILRSLLNSHKNTCCILVVKRNTLTKMRSEYSVPVRAHTVLMHLQKPCYHNASMKMCTTAGSQKSAILQRHFACIFLCVARHPTILSANKRDLVSKTQQSTLLYREK